MSCLLIFFTHTVSQHQVPGKESFVSKDENSLAGAETNGVDSSVSGKDEDFSSPKDSSVGTNGVVPARESKPYEIPPALFSYYRSSFEKLSKKRPKSSLSSQYELGPISLPRWRSFFGGMTVRSML